VCFEPKDRQYVLEHLGELVVKAANESGGYGMLVGPHSTVEEQSEFAKRIESESEELHRATDPLAVARAGHRGRSLRRPPRRFRPYILYGKDIFVMPGGLTRVALKKGSLVVNSSQGGGSKDTWVLA